MARIHGWIISPALWGKNAGAENTAAFVGDRHNASLAPVFGTGTVIFGERRFQPDGIDPRCSGLSLGHADMGKLGVGIGHPRYSPIINLCRQAEQHVADNDAGMITGDMGELLPPGNISNGKDTAVCCPQAGIGADPAAAGFYPRCLKIKPVDIGPPSDSHQAGEIR